jgi:hypothetical protein
MINNMNEDKLKHGVTSISYTPDGFPWTFAGSGVKAIRWDEAGQLYERDVDYKALSRARKVQAAPKAYWA